MKLTATILAVLLTAATAAAQEQTTARDEPDYSRETLLQIFAESGDEEEPAVRHHIGAIDVRALGTTLRIGYLPMFVPLAGSIIRTTQQWPDAFSLTGMQIATSPRAWRTQRAMSRELRRIEQSERAKIRID